MLLHDLILDTARSHDCDVALIRDTESVDYGQLADRVSRFADGLSSLAREAGERTAVLLNKRIETVVAYFGVSLAGGVFVPINPVLKPAQVRHILKDCDVTHLITSYAQASTLREVLGDCSALRNLILVGDPSSEVSDVSEVNQLNWSDLDSLASGASTRYRRIDNDIAAILYTSGSTGNPKGVVLSHRNMVNGAISVSSYIENSPEDRILSVLPFSFDAGFSQLTTGFGSGAAVILLDYLLPRDVIKAAVKHSATGITGVPPLWNQLAKLDWPEEAVRSLRYIANTGGAMPTATLEELRKRLPSTTPFLMYGLTEAFRSTYLPPAEVDKRPTSIGKAIPDAEILVVNEDGSLCGPGEPGELVHRGALVSLGYWNDPERTAERFKPVPSQLSELPFPEIAVWSGDTVVTDEEGFIYFVGRKDDMIKSSGYRISPTEIEEFIYNTELVIECAAIGVPHAQLGQAVVIVASSSQQSDDTVARIVTACKKDLPNFMVPARIVWQDSLPRNPNGKIDRKGLSNQYKKIFDDGA